MACKPSEVVLPGESRAGDKVGGEDYDGGGNDQSTLSACVKRSQG